MAQIDPAVASSLDRNAFEFSIRLRLRAIGCAAAASFEFQPLPEFASLTLESPRCSRGLKRLF